VRILTTIVDSTPDGYGAADARFLLGMILWDENNVPDAVRWWSDITPDDRGMYAPVYGGILDVLRSSSSSRAARISVLLGAEYRRWLEFSSRRLAEFGYRLDTF
jgi:hypothetical protein